MSDELLELAQRVAGWADGGEQVEVFAARSRTTQVKVFGGEVESLSSAASEGIGVRVVASGRQGFAYAGTLGEDALGETLTEARDNAGFASPDPHAGLAEPDGVVSVGTDLWRDALAAVSADDKVSLTLELERLGRAADPRIRQVEAEYGDDMTEFAVASSTGIAAGDRRSACSAFAFMIAGDRDETQTGFGFSVGRTLADLDVERAAQDGVGRATRMLGATKPRSKRLTVVLDPYVTATLLGVVGSTLSGEQVLKGRSIFAERVGEDVATADFTLVDDPTEAEAYGAANVDAEGLACRRNELIEGGILRGFLYNSHAARRAGTESTGSAVRSGFKSAPNVGARALALRPGRDDQQAILRAVGDGLLVQNVSGVHSGVNPISGDVSLGAEGRLFTGGELGQPVREMTIGSTLQRMLKDVVAVGSDVERLPGSATGVTLAIADVTMAGD